MKGEVMTKEQLTFVSYVSREFSGLPPHLAGELAKRLMAVARKATRNAENLCNVPDYKDKRDEIEADVVEIFEDCCLPGRAHNNGRFFRVDSDPRGYCLRVFFPSGVYNSWGGKEDGYGVPC
jgi:hypothetical protein